MGSCKQQRLSWIIILISAAAVSVSCQELTSTLREGNRTCLGDEVTFICTLRGSLALAWRSPGYIADGNPLQFSTASMLDVDVPSMINGRITATATLTRNTMDNGEQVLVSTLRITATVASTVTCSGTNGVTLSIGFSISAVPGVPQRIHAAETSQPVGTTCIILVTWDPPANSDASDIVQYIIYIPSRNIREVSPSTISTLTVPNCGIDTHVQVAAVNLVGCVGMNSSEVQLTLLDIPTASTEDGSATTSNQLGAGDIAAIVLGCLILILGAICAVLIAINIYFLRCHRKRDSGVAPDKTSNRESHKQSGIPKTEDVEYTWESQNKALMQAKECYQKQSKHDIGHLGTEKDRVSVPIWIDEKLDRSWKGSLRKAVKAINKAAPGLSLSIAENKDKKRAIIHVLAIDEKKAYTKGNILLRSTSGQADYITKIHLGKWEDDTKDGISTRELFIALGFHPAENLGLTRFDPLSITLYQSEETYDSAQRKYPGDPVWWLKKHSINKLKVNTELSELDKVSLNLIYRPCRDTGAGYKPKLGETGMYYCGRHVMSSSTCTYSSGKDTDYVCGPDKGPNCPACRTIKNGKVEEILTNGKWQGMTGRVYCGRLFTEPAQICEHHDGICGINIGPACPDCNNLLNEETIHRI